MVLLAGDRGGVHVRLELEHALLGQAAAPTGRGGGVHPEPLPQFRLAHPAVPRQGVQDGEVEAVEVVWCRQDGRGGRPDAQQFVGGDLAYTTIAVLGALYGILTIITGYLARSRHPLGLALEHAHQEG